MALRQSDKPLRREIGHELQDYVSSERQVEVQRASYPKAIGQRQCFLAFVALPLFSRTIHRFGVHVEN